MNEEANESNAQQQLSLPGEIKAPTGIKQNEYYRTLAQIKRSFPFHSVQGKISPYTAQTIQTMEEYNVYCSCLALRIVCEENASSAKLAVDEAHARADVAIKAAALSEQRERWTKNALIHAQAEKTRYEKRSKLLSCVSALLCIFLLILLIGNQHQYKQTAPGSAEISTSSSSITKKSNAASGSSRPDGYISDDYIGNRNSHKFHRSSCSYLPDESNQVIFKSRESAIKAGYSPCGRCNP